MSSIWYHCIRCQKEINADEIFGFGYCLDCWENRDKISRTKNLNHTYNRSKLAIIIAIIAIIINTINLLRRFL